MAQIIRQFCVSHRNVRVSKNFSLQMKKIFKKDIYVITLNSSYMHHSTLWKSWNMQSWLHMLKKNRIICIGTNTYIYICTKLKKLTTLSHQCSVFSCSPTHTSCDCQRVAASWELSSEYGAKKFQTALSISEQRNQKHIQKSVSPVSVLRGLHSAVALCKLLWAALPVKATKGFHISAGHRWLMC